MTRRARRNRTPGFKAKVALAAIKGEADFRTPRSTRTPPSEDKNPLSNLTSTRLPQTGDRPGNGNTGSFMAGAARQKSPESAQEQKFYAKSST
jgi:hypothetical protein